MKLFVVCFKDVQAWNALVVALSCSEGNFWKVAESRDLFQTDIVQSLTVAKSGVNVRGNWTNKSN